MPSRARLARFRAAAQTRPLEKRHTERGLSPRVRRTEAENAALLAELRRLVELLPPDQRAAWRAKIVAACNP